MPASRRIDPADERKALSQAIFSPASIAIVGVTGDERRLASRPERILRRHGYPGVILPVEYVAALSDFAEHCTAIPSANVDHAYIVTAPTAVASAVASCAAAGVRVATILSAGFAERGAAGKRRQDALIAVARAAGMRLIGPNSLGVVNVPGKMVLSTNAVLEHEALRPGHLSLVSQSGSMLGAILTRAQERGFGFSKLVSIGNESDIAVGELVDLLVDDPDTQAILLFLESFRDADALARAARRAFDACKPVIALKLGRTRIGREASTSHTGALLGDDDIAGAFFRAHGIIRVRDLEALFESVPLVLHHRPARARRVAAVTVSGGGATMVLDRLDSQTVDVVPPPPALIRELARRRIRVSAAPFIDLPMGRADDGAYARVLDALLASDHCDLVLAVLGSNAAHMLDSVRERLLPVRHVGKPLAVFAAPRAEAALRLLQDAGIAAFRTPESCADAIRACLEWHTPSSPMTVNPTDALRASECARRVAQDESPSARSALAAIEHLGIAVPPGTVVQTGEERLDLPFPVAAKILSPDLVHKTDVGGVELDIQTPTELRRRIAAVLARVRTAAPSARIQGVLVQAMAQGIAEVIAGYRFDRDIGPIVTVGLGGIYAELSSERAVRVAPVSVEAARAMIDDVPGFAVLRGYRNRPAADIGALALAVHRLSLFAQVPSVLEAEINPLIVGTQGVLAVDGLFRLRTDDQQLG